MKAFKRGAKWGAYKFVPKAFNLIVILTLVLQPAGTSGIWNIALAQSVEPDAPAVEEAAPAPDPVKEEKEAAPAEEVKPVVEEAIVPVDTTPAPSDIPAESAAPTSSIGDTGASTDIPSNSEETTLPLPVPAEEVVPPVTTDETTVTSPETPAPTEETTTTDTTTSSAEAVEPTVAPVSQETPVEEAVSVVTEPIDETVCLAASVEGDSAANWTIDEEQNTAVTNGAVELGVRYIFPLDKEVSVTFTCLPKDLGKRAPLSIERIKASDINLPDGVSAASEYAYDITTDGMKNGDFKYDLSLPQSKIAGAEVKYIEQSADEVVASDVPENDLKAVDEDNVKEENDSVTVSDLDHFTIFIATYADFSFVTSETTYLPSDTVYVKAASLSSGAYYRVDIIDPAGSTRTNIVVCQNGATTLGGSYILSASATISTDWQAEITQYADNGNCTARSSIQDTGTAVFGVVAYNASSANPTLSQACGLDIALVIDNSNSIDSTELGQMKTALKGFVNALAGTPTQFSVTRFGTSASVPQGFTSNTALVNSAIDSVALGGGGTDWQEGISTARGTFDPGPKPNLMIFASDGNPTYPGNGYDTTPENVNAAIAEANAAKALNIRMLALGIGEVILDSSDSLRLENLKAISGHIVNDADIEHSDVITTSFAEMAAKLRHFAEATCGGTVTVTKKIDADGNLQTLGDQTVASGWTFNVGGQTGQVTDAHGQTAAVTLAAGSGYSVTETPQAGYTLASAICTGAANNGSKSGDAVTGIAINNTNIVSCTFINTPIKGSITIVKDAVPDSAQNFSFTTTGAGLSNFSLDDDGNNGNTLSNTRVFNNLTPGLAYAVSEGAVNNWVQTSAVCSDGSPVGAISLQPGENITCTFTNTFVGKPNLTVLKTNDAGQNPAAGTPFTWKLHVANVGVASASFGDTQTILTDNLPAGATYGTPAVSNASGVTGTIDCGTITSDNLNCTASGAVTIGVGGSFDVTFTATPIASGTFSNPRNGGICVVDPNNGVTESNEDDNTCSDTVIVNALPTTLSVYKVCDPTGDTGLFNLQIDGVNKTTNTVCGGWTNGPIEVTVGSHTVGETGGSGTNLANYTSVISGDCASDGSVTLAAGEHKSCTITNTKRGMITVHKDVVKPDGVTDVTDSHSFTARLNGASPQSISEGTNVTYGNLTPGTYAVSEDVDSNYTLVSITPDSDGVTDDAQVVVSAGANTDVFVVNKQKPGTITGFKWNDLNGNHEYDCNVGESLTNFVESVDQSPICEPKLSEWTIFIDANQSGILDNEEVSTTTDENGDYSFSGLAPGTYRICEVMEDGWNQTYPQNEGLNNCYEVTIGSNGSSAGNDFGNHFTPPVLQISKANDSGAPETPGNDILYTITVTAPESNTTDVEDIHVTDLPPAGFEYVDGSAIASQGGLTHVYASPGVWSLGTMHPGDTVTLTYTAKISGSQDAGTYEDLAFARGTSAVDDLVLADCVGSCQEEGSTPFTGTDVEVVLPAAPVAVALVNTVERHVDTQTIHKTKRVLGAATVLPSTGSSINTVLFALMLLLGGLILLLLSKRSTWLLIRSLSKSMVKVFLFAVIGSSLLLTIQAASASSTLNVQIETPKAQVSDPNFKIGFVVLDINNGTPSVTCEVNDGGGFTNFPAAHIEYDAQPSGNSGNCVVDAAVMPADGTYTFRVTADSVSSDEVSVTLISGTPSTPLNYSRASGSCTVSFTTANDGLTDTVELYRSLSSTFTADASTLAATSASIGPNVAGVLTDPNGDCGGSYFYAIRAVAASGLGSGFVGDERVVIDNENKIKYKTDTKKVAGPTTVATGAIPVTTGGGAGTGTEGAVEGAATTGEEEGIQPETDAEGSVLGEETGAAGEAAGGFADWIQSHPWWSALIALIALALGYYGYETYQRKHNEPLQ